MTGNIIKDEWLSEIIGKNSYRLIVDETLLDQKESFIRRWLANFKEERIFIYSKVGTDRLPHACFLEECGFRLIDTNIKLNKVSGLNERVRLSNNCEVRFTEPEDKTQVVDLAKANFKFSRFHLDPAIGKSTANDIKGKWVENYYYGERGDEMVVALIDGQVAGFLQLIKKNSLLVVDLIAVDARYRGRRIASDMIVFAKSRIDYSEMIVGTQVSNIPSLRLYENLGFKARSSEYVFHFHR